MRRWILLSLVILLLLVGGVVLVGYFAAQQVPEFYERELAVDRSRQQAASNEMFNRTKKLETATKNIGYWEALFTAEQINGFLAVDLELH
ncbi:MAG: hypothetical protein WD176_03905, partial [Pirellulales bacterium]